ncbi:putative xyloglucan 6-xylosyltransferase [Helianthus anomalus]
MLKLYVDEEDDVKKDPNVSVLLVTGSSPKPCENPVGDHYLLKSIKNKIDYYRIHIIWLCLMLIIIC